jgi:hypothetical protein
MLFGLCNCSPTLSYIPIAPDWSRTVLYVFGSLHLLCAVLVTMDHFMVGALSGEVSAPDLFVGKAIHCNPTP